MHRPRDPWQSQNDSYSFEQVQNGLGAVSSCTFLLSDIGLTSDRWIASSQTRLWADHKRYRWHQCWLARFFHHPFHNQPLSIHEPNKLMSSPCYSPVSNMPPCLQDTMAPKRCHIFYFGLRWKRYHFSLLSRSGQIFACKWWQFYALFNIRVDLKLVRIKLIFLLYPKSDLINCLRGD